MSDQPFERGRRRAMKLALGGMVAIPFANVLLQSPAVAKKLSPSDPQAKQLKYTETSPKEGQYCDNCKYYGGGAEWGPCQLFQGQEVAAKGWCSAWATA